MLNLSDKATKFCTVAMFVIVNIQNFVPCKICKYQCHMHMSNSLSPPSHRKLINFY